MKKIIFLKMSILLFLVTRGLKTWVKIAPVLFDRS